VRRSAIPLLLAALAIVATACQVAVGVTIDVAADGSGMVGVEVILDAEAAARLGDPSAAVQLDDLREAGWTVDEPARADDGSVLFSGRREFADPDQLALVLAEVGGTDGVFDGIQLEVEDRFGRAEYRFAATVNLSGSLEQFSDPALTEALGGQPLARNPEELAAAGDDNPGSATLTVSVALPGDPRTTGSVDGGRATWTFPMTGGQATSQRIEVAATTAQGRTGLFVVVAVVAAVAAAIAATIGVLRRRS
jgi:hypothetical protein